MLSVLFPCKDEALTSRLGTLCGAWGPSCGRVRWGPVGSSLLVGGGGQAEWGVKEGPEV